MPAELARLYEDDDVLWCDRQAELMRRLQSGERVNAQIDWDDVIEEIEPVGRSQLNAVESCLVVAIARAGVLASSLGGQRPGPLPDACPFAFDDLLVADPDIADIPAPPAKLSA